PNIALLMQETVLTPFLKMGLHPTYARPLFLFVLVVITFIGLMLFLRSNFGLAMRATGANQRMAGAQGIQTGFYVFTGVALSNGLVGIGGALFAQVNGFADVTTGVGTIVVGLASVIVGETLLRGRFIWIALIGCILGSIIYRIAVQLALSADVIGLKASDLNLATAVLVALALILPRLGKGKSA
ncbi:MAG: ABC transporter permease, partial [Rhizobiales bacterium]|nr:ABC transporter permease [Hyphomicrobiales bacterium]